MSQIYIIAGMLCLISLLVCFVFIRQTIVKKQQEKARLSRALVKRAKFLQQMLESFPQGFLPTDLSVLLLRSIVDTFEQLTKLLPEETQYVDHFKLYTTMLEEAIKNSSKEEPSQAAIDNSSQIAEIRQSLNQLSRFIQSSAKRGSITQKQFILYKSQIKKLAVQVMVDNYMIAASQAVDSDKLKLGIHYYTLAKNLIAEEGLSTIKRKELMQIAEKVPSLQSLLDDEIQQRAQETVADSAAAGELENQDAGQWAELDEEDDWKKKNLYD